MCAGCLHTLSFLFLVLNNAFKVNDLLLALYDTLHSYASHHLVCINCLLQLDDCNEAQFLSALVALHLDMLRLMGLWWVFVSQEGMSPVFNIPGSNWA
jgi:hypothetical protein